MEKADRNENKHDQEVAREAVRKYKQQLLNTIDGFPENVDQEGLSQILTIVRLEKAKVDDEFRLKIWLRKDEDEELLHLLSNVRLPPIFECYFWHLESEADAKNLK